MRKLLIMLTPAAIMFLAAPFAAAQESQSPAPVKVDAARGLPEWDKVYKVFSHPRCADCHVADDRPRWSGAHYGGTRVHGFNVQRGSDGSGFGNPGLRCTTCHFSSNSKALYGPPGAENWHLAPAEMVWFGKSSAEICAQIKDPARNGGRSLQDVALHVRDDKLVAWGWAPGADREPAPGSAEETYNAIENWMAAGAPCPAAQ
ncbi:MAG: hypothetical protein EOS58_08870 [Mesorhizobium sp.]|uniref:hypothetical protein n=1 Tax=Mesorhizobium sp. TaxID=1871066 RepID=UPI000FEA112B|nr:hypothetical protein [Mesorhizobium sp.]RWD05786.1 MAG: hypothetical protein EOS58_08870 [Mesorhizobium sp.]RWD24565.1 MAG: hypothetical protein EOS22_22450 [Mesorhizobium sp.]TJW57665.1 MAG: hypothetical protein E5V29_32380 [Mesorhizobium sp.]